MFHASLRNGFFTDHRMARDRRLELIMDATNA
jgi:hypothetical protein